jgi:hypothetical protein
VLIMEKTDIALIRCYSENFNHKTSINRHEPACSDLKISFSDGKIKNTYLLTINISVNAVINDTELSISTFTEFWFRCENFDPQPFYAKEIETMVELVSCAYNNARILFYVEYKSIKHLQKFYLPFKFASDIKSWMANSDVYNKL